MKILVLSGMKQRILQETLKKGDQLFDSGFTLLEMLVVVALIGIVGMIVAPGYLGFLDENRLNDASKELYAGIREAQLQAQSRRTAWQFSMRENNNTIEWATHAKSMSPADSVWNESFESSAIQIDDETTFANTGGVYYVRFDEDGNVQYRLGRITLSSRSNPKLKRCVIVSTIVGAMRRSKEQAVARDGKMCY